MEQNTFIIYQGDDKTMPLKAVYAASGDPLDLTSCTEIDVALPIVGGGFVHRLLSLSQVVITSPAVLGKFTCHIPSFISLTLLPGELQFVDVTFTIGSEIFTVRFLQALSVLER